MPSIEYRPDRPKPYRARYWGPDGRLHSRSFARKDDAERWLTSEEAPKLRGAWVDPSGSRRRFDDWATQWWELWASDPHRSPAALEAAESHLRLHIRPHPSSTSNRPSSNLRPDRTQARAAQPDLSVDVQEPDDRPVRRVVTRQASRRRRGSPSLLRLVFGVPGCGRRGGALTGVWLLARLVSWIGSWGELVSLCRVAHSQQWSTGDCQHEDDNDDDYKDLQDTFLRR
jgi:hypothetical protein